jgi:dihydroorotate dehydrogenase electron transfer subunit
MPTEPLHKPTLWPDGSITGVVAQAINDAGSLTLRLPYQAELNSSIHAGRYFLARCSQDSGPQRQEWSIYLRRPLFAAAYSNLGQEAEWQLQIPDGLHPDPSQDPGYHWLANLHPDQSIHLLGPLGQGFRLDPTTRNLLLLADVRGGLGWLMALLPLIHPALDQSGQVTLLIRREAALPEGLLEQLPLPVEVQTFPTEEGWQQALTQHLTWADQICAGLPRPGLSGLAHTIQAHRFRVEEGFAQVLVAADLLCGTGGCMACVVPLGRGGVTRACVHGPVFDLIRLVG